MSKQAKIIIYSVVLLFSIYLKFYDGNSSNENTTRKRESTERKTVERKPVERKTAERKPVERKTVERKPLKKKDKIYTISYKSNGYSPYDSYFGKGVYNNSLDNSINVSAPSSSDIVFLLKNVYSGKTIRNEYIRRGTTFNLSGVPYGTYVFSYFSGRDWSDEVTLKNGLIKGGFTKGKSFSKSEKIEDYMEFKDGYYGSYTIRLTEVVNGNLETQSSNEDEFFN